MTEKRPVIPSHRQSAFEVYRKPVSPVVLDTDKKLIHLEDMLRNLNLNKPRPVAAQHGTALMVDRDTATTIHQLKDQNGLLVNMCLELGSELAALKYRREEMAVRLQQVCVSSRHPVANGSVATAATTAVVSGVVTVAGGGGVVISTSDAVTAGERGSAVGQSRQ